MSDQTTHAAAGVQRDPAATALGRGKLSLLDVVAQSIGFIGPVFSAAFLLPSIAGLGATGKGAGVASPVALIIATIGMCGVAWIISRYAKRIHAAGALYDYVTDGFGQRVGFISGWIYYGGMTMLTFAIFPAFGGFLALTLLGNHDIDVSWLVLALGGIALVFGMTILGVQVSTRAQLVLALVSVAVVLGYSIYVIAKGGTAGNSSTPFDPSGVGLSDILYGLLYATLVFTGFETAANLAEETANPKRAIPRAIMSSVLLVGAFYVIVMYAMEAAFGFDMSAFLDLANFPPLYTAAATPGLGSSGFGELVQWIVVLDILAVALGCANACSRGYYALARDGRLPAPLAVVHPRFRTPWIAALLIGAGCVVVAVLTETMDGIVAGADSDPGVWFRFFQFGATFGALGLILVYLLISLSGFKSQPGESRIGLAVAAVIGTASTVAATFGTLYKAPSVYALDKVSWLMGIWIIAGLAVTVLLASRGAFRRPTAAQALAPTGD
jgi:amino acid transporter